MTIIVPAVLVKTESEFAKRFSQNQIRSRAALWQIDVLDGSLYGQTSFADADIASSYHLPGIELHLMVKNPLPIVRAWKRQVPSVRRAIVHAEIDRQLAPILHAIEESELETGVALNPETPIEDYRQEIDRADVLLIMGVHPGKSGQTFLGDPILEKIQRARTLFPQKTIAVDGGVTLENAQAIVNAGATQLCVASAIWNAKDPENAFDTLVETSV